MEGIFSGVAGASKCLFRIKRVVPTANQPLLVYPEQQAWAIRQRCEMTNHCKLIRPTGKICSIFLTIASDAGLFIAKSRARKLKFVEAIQSDLGCQFSMHKYSSF